MKVRAQTLLAASVFALNTSSVNAFQQHTSQRYKSQLFSTAVFDTLMEAPVIDPGTGNSMNALEGMIPKSGDFFQNLFGDKNANEKTLVVIMPQLGDFDSSEYAEFLSAVSSNLSEAKIGLRVIGIGTPDSAKKFANFNGLDISCLKVDPEGQVHKSLALHAGPNWDVPSFLPQSLLEWFAYDYCGANEEQDAKAISRAWLNYMAMCAGIAAPDTLPEILRGYFGDKSAPERISADEVVVIGSDEDPVIAIKGVSDVKLGPFKYQQLWKNEEGYQRPVELATVRLRAMVEVLTNFNEYVPDQRFLDLRGATFLFDNETKEIIYEHRDTGVLSYSKTMARPLSFLEPYIGEKALNPLGLKDKAINL